MFNDLLTRGFFDFGLEVGFGDILRLAPLKKLPMIGLVFMLEGEETIDWNIILLFEFWSQRAVKMLSVASFWDF